MLSFSFFAYEWCPKDFTFTVEIRSKTNQSPVGALQSKSEFNQESARILIGASLYAPSVHCSYYACFQISKDRIIERFGIPITDIDSAVRNGKSGEHVFVANFIQERLTKMNFVREAREYGNAFKQLKNLRVKADYALEQIDSAKAMEAVGYRDAVISIIRSLL